MKYDVVSLGPARMDVFVGLPEDEVLESCSLDRQKCVISLGFGDKIPVKSISFAIGGNTGNNAVGLSRLGYKVAMMGTMGKEWVDQRALDVLKTEGVDVTNIKQVDGQFGFGVIINYQGERTILSYYPDSECDFMFTDLELETKWLYLTTAGQNYECFYEEAVKWAKSKDVKIAFNPGSRQVKDGVGKLSYVFLSTEILFVNREEAQRLLDKRADEDIKNLLSGLVALGPKLVVITDGPNGTFAFDGDDFWKMPIVDAPVVERTGAGDAFGSGFMAAHLAGKSVYESLKWGTINSASVLGYIGPQAGLLKTEQLDAWLQRSQSAVPEKI